MINTIPTKHCITFLINYSYQLFSRLVKCALGNFSENFSFSIVPIILHNLNVLFSR